MTCPGSYHHHNMTVIMEMMATFWSCPPPHPWALLPVCDVMLWQWWWWHHRAHATMVVRATTMSACPGLCHHHCEMMTTTTTTAWQHHLCHRNNNNNNTMSLPPPPHPHINNNNNNDAMSPPPPSCPHVNEDNKTYPTPYHHHSATTPPAQWQWQWQHCHGAHATAVAWATMMMTICLRSCHPPETIQKASQLLRSSTRQHKPLTRVRVGLSPLWRWNSKRIRLGLPVDSLVFIYWHRVCTCLYWIYQYCLGQVIVEINNMMQLHGGGKMKEA